MSNKVEPEGLSELDNVNGLAIPAAAEINQAAAEIRPSGDNQTGDSHTPLKREKAKEKANQEKLSFNKKRIIFMVKSAAGIKRKPRPFLPPNSLSVVERYFHHMKENSAQVVLTYGGRISMPKGSTHLSVSRLIDVMKIASSEVYRSASVLDYDTHQFTPMSQTASGLKINFKFTELTSDQVFSTVAQQELNQKYDVHGSEPLWNVHIIGPKEVLDGINCEPNSDCDFPKFYIFWSFHHCIADGLSGWAFIRVFMSKMVPEHFQKNPVSLESIPVNQNPPPLIDNLIYANFFEVIPALFSAAYQLMVKSNFKKYRLKNFCTESVPVNFSPMPAVDPPTATKVLFFEFDSKFSEDLRLNCRKNKTTIASAVIVAALAASRAVFAPKAASLNKKLPGFQSWVVTSSTRHLIPNSKLLEGSDKETDPALMEFGGYGGSMTHEKFKFRGSSDLWDRCRAVKNHLASSFLRSMRRMKLMNYLFRKPKLWAKLQKNVDLSDVTRSYSVEVANLGSWANPYSPGSTRSDLATADWFAGSLNNSFHGARAIFTIALISINNIMSFTVAYDMSVITAEEGQVFVESVKNVLTMMKSSPGGKILVKDMEK